MRRIKSRVDIVFTILILLVAMNIAVFIFRLMRGECLFVDFRARWQESAYLFHGINPFDALAGKVTIDSIGVIDPDMVTVPWAWVLGFVINPGFMSYDAAKIWGMMIYFIICTTTAFVCYKYVVTSYFCDVQEKNKKQKWCVCAVFIVLAQYCWVWSFMCGNHGALACCFVVIAVCIYKQHPYWAGILMAFAMIKPQVTVPFFITFLLLKQFKLIFISTIIGIATMCLIYAITGVGLFNLLSATSQIGTNLDLVFFGLFNMLKYSGVSSKLIIVLDVIVGVLYSIVVTWIMYKQEDADDDMRIFVGAAISSTFWFYKQSHDYVILIIPCIVLLNGLHRVNNKLFWVKLLALVSFIVCFYAQSAIRKIVNIIYPFRTEQFGKELFMTFTCIFMMLMGIVLVGIKDEKTGPS